MMHHEVIDQIKHGGDRVKLIIRRGIDFGQGSLFYYRKGSSLRGLNYNFLGYYSINNVFVDV